MPYTDDEVIAQYLNLRTKKQALEKEHEKELAPYKTRMTAIENYMLAVLNERGAQNTKSESGIAFKETTVSAKVSDRDAFLNYVQDHGAWSLLTNHVSKEQVMQIIDLTKSPPPGVSVTTMVKVHFRKG